MPNKIIHLKDSIRLKEIQNKWTIEPLKLKHSNYIPKKRSIFNWPNPKKKNMTINLIPIKNEFKVEKRESEYFESKTMSNVNNYF